METKLPLFVYGTLRENAPNYGLVQHLTRVNAKTRGTLYHLPAGYPALQLQGDRWVYGDLLGTPGEKLLRILDVYEGTHENLYQRVKVEVLVGLMRHQAWTYVMARPDRRKGVIIPSGRWQRANWT